VTRTPLSRSKVKGSYSLKHIVRTIEQRSYDLRRRYDTTYSQNVSQTVIVSYVRWYDMTSVLLASLMFYISIEKMPLDAPKHVILTLKNPNNNYYYYELAG